MKRIWHALGLVLISISLAHAATDATIAGSVKGPGGAPVRGAFVRAQNLQSKISVDVLSDSAGRYRISHLVPGEYQVRANATGYKADARNGVKLSAGDSASIDISHCRRSPVRWGDLSLVSGQNADA